jgi:hypothetical protein
MKRRASLVAAAAVVLLASASAVGAAAYLYQQFVVGTAQAQSITPPAVAPGHAAPATPVASDTAADNASSPVIRQLPADASLTILVGSYPVSSMESNVQIRSLTEWLEASGFHVYFAEVDLGPRGRWQRVLAGAYTDPDAAGRDVMRLRGADPASEARVVTAGFATGVVAAASGAPEDGGRRTGI